MPSALELDMCKYQGEHVTRITRDLVAGSRVPRTCMSDATRAERCRQHRTPFPLLRQPPEVPGVRQHLQREAEGRRPRAPTSCAQIRPTPPALRHLRRRHGRRDGARAAHAQRARLVPDGAAARGRQGDQPRGRAPRAREDGGPLSRASDHRARGHQPALRRRAGACVRATRGRRRGSTGRCCRLTGDSPTSTRGRSTDLGSALDSRLGDAARAKPPATRSTCGPRCW